MFHEYVSKCSGTRIELYTVEQVRMMLLQLFVHERPRNNLGQLGNSRRYASVYARAPNVRTAWRLRRVFAVRNKRRNLAEGSRSRTYQEASDAPIWV